MKRLLMVSLFALAACQSAGSGTGEVASAGNSAARSDDPCNAATYESLVGTSGNDVRESMFPAGARVLRPGMVMTMDYRADRLNVVIDDAGKVDRVYCG